jgi:hypothetical protein
MLEGGNGSRWRADNVGIVSERWELDVWKGCRRG